MKLDQKIILLMTSLAAVAAAHAQRPAAFGLLDGHYERTHRIITLDAEEVAHDWLTLQHEAEGYHFDTELEFDFKGRCALTGYALMEPVGGPPVTVTYRQPAEQAVGRPCVLRMKISPTEITFDDPRYSCNSFCSMGGSMHGTVFKRATREPLD